MLTSRPAVSIVLVIAGQFALSTSATASPPTNEELAQRDRWVAEHFPAHPAGPLAPPDAQAPGLVVWVNHGPVVYNTVLGGPLRIADQAFEHGVYTHAPSRVQVILPGPARSFSATVGILTNPNSVGGSTVCSISLGEKEVYASAVLHRGEPGIPMKADLAGARTFSMNVGTAGDGISSDQTVWGNAAVTLADGKEVRLSDLPLRDPLTQPRQGSTPPFSFTYGDRHSDELLPAWKIHDERDASKPGLVTRVRTYTDPATGLVVRCTAVEYAHFPTVEWTLSFKNTGTHDTPILAGILPLDTRLQGSSEGEFLLHHFIGSICAPNDYEPLEDTLGPDASQRITTQGGRPTNSDLPYFNIETGGGGVIAVISWAGQWAAQFTRDAGHSLRLTGAQECTAFRLHPGEEVRSPLVVLQFYKGDWVRAQNVWRSWMLAHNVPRHAGKPLDPFIFVCNGNFYPGLMTDAATELVFLSRYYEEGIQADYWNQDAGWYPCAPVAWPKVGTWAVDTARFPKGIREVSDYLKAHGTKTITWFEPERVHPDTELANEHPEWIYGGAGGGLLKLGDPECRAWITDRVSKILTEQGIDFYRQDFNIDPLFYWRGNDADDRQGITEIHHVEGYFAYWDELVRRHPDLWIDSCASGGRRNDLETLRRAVPILRSDWTPDPSNPATDPFHQQNHMYGISFWMPYNGTGYMTIDKYLARSVMTTIHGIGVDTRRKDLDYDLLRRLYRDWKAISACYLGDYYPLTPYRKTAEFWAAWQFDLPEKGTGMVQAFRRQNCPEASITLKLRGLDPGAEYELTDLDSPGVRRVTGRELLETGLTVTSSEKPNAMILTYRRVAGGPAVR